MNDKKIGGGRFEEFVANENSDLPSKIERSDLRVYPIAAGETEIVLQRHGKYSREKDDPRVGSLTAEAIEEERAAATAFFESLLSPIPEEERNAVDVLVLTSDTQYRDGGRRSQETAEIVQAVAKEVMTKYGIPLTNLLNTAGTLRGEGGPRPMSTLREPAIFTKSPDFVDFMLKKYGGINLDFWIAFEEDRDKDTRIAMGAEGPDEIVDRLAFTLRVLNSYASSYHQAKPNRRLIVWAATHYDTISPFVKREILGVSKEHQMMVDYGAGISIHLHQDGKATTQLGGKEYDVPLARKTT